MAMLQHALAWAKRGYRVFPLAPNSRVPAWADWDWRVEASNDPAVVYELVEGVGTNPEVQTAVALPAPNATSVSISMSPWPMARKVANAAGNLRGKKVAVLGLTFKPDTDDMREAPSIPLVTGLLDMGAKVRAHDPVGMEQARKELPEIVAEHNCLAVEMEAFALFANARYLKKTAGTLLTISDVIPTGEVISPEAREKSLKPMIELALEACVEL